MAEVQLRDLKNKVVGKLELADDVFDYQASEILVWEAVKAHQAAQRKGTSAARTRSMARGGGRKPWRQKGTGRARAGTIRSPLWAGGGTVHGPTPRDYSESFPRKKRRGAVKLVLSDKLRNDRLVVTEDLELGSNRTRDFVDVLKQLELNDKVLIVDEGQNQNLYLGSRNLQRVKMVNTGGVNVYDLLNCDHLLISKQALLKLQEALQK